MICQIVSVRLLLWNFRLTGNVNYSLQNGAELQHQWWHNWCILSCHLHDKYTKKNCFGWNVNDYLKVAFLIKYKPIDYGYCKSFLKEAKHKSIITHPLGKKGKLPVITLGRNNIPGFLTLHASNNKVFWHTETNKLVKVLDFFFFPVFLFKNNSTTLFMSVSYFLLIQGHAQYAAAIIWA